MRTKWEYLTLRVQFDMRGWNHESTKWYWGVGPTGPLRDMYQPMATKYLESRADVGQLWSEASSPHSFVAEVLGPDGWELVQMVDHRRMQVLYVTKDNADKEFDHNHGWLIDYRMWFKRPSDLEGTTKLFTR